jgi:Glycosyl hydrolases family 11
MISESLPHRGKYPTKNQIEMKKPKLSANIVLITVALALQWGSASNAAAQITKEAGPTYGLAFGVDRNTFYYRVWRDRAYGSASITIGYPELGRFTGKWNNVKDMTVGKGWGTNGNDTKKFTFRVNDNKLSSTGWMTFGVYGWTTGSGYGVGANEFYVDERWTGNNPGNGITYVGGFQADGSSYAVYRQPRYGMTPVGKGDFLQYRSVRASQRTDGTVQTKLHFNYWKNLTGGRAYRLNGFLYSTFGVEAMDFTSAKATGECDVWITSSDG